MTTNIIETHSLTKGTGSQMRVNHLDLRVPEGCVYGFLRPNGAGKTTTLKLLLSDCSDPPMARSLCSDRNDRQKQTRNPKAHWQPHRKSQLLRPSHRTENLQIIAKLKKSLLPKLQMCSRLCASMSKRTRRSNSIPLA